MTLQEQRELIGKQIVKIENEADEKIQVLENEILELNKIECPDCEGLGIFQFKDFIDKCETCNGTGSQQD